MRKIIIRGRRKPDPEPAPEPVTLTSEAAAPPPTIEQMREATLSFRIQQLEDELAVERDRVAMLVRYLTAAEHERDAAQEQLRAIEFRQLHRGTFPQAFTCPSYECPCARCQERRQRPFRDYIDPPQFRP